MTKPISPCFKLQIREENGIWSDVTDSAGTIELFDTQRAAREALESRYPVLLRMEQYGGTKSTRIIDVNAYADKDTDMPD